MAMRCQAIDRIHSQTKPFEDIVVGLAEQMGFQKYFDFSREEVAVAMLKPLKITLNDLRQKGTIVLDGKAKELSFDTSSGKVELYCKAFAEHGFEPVPVWQPPLAKAGKNSFVLIHGKQGIMSHTATANIPALLQIAKKYNMERIWINASKAKQLGIKDGDLVEVSSPRAAGKVRVKVTERVHPDAAFLPAGYGNLSPWLKTGYGFGINPNDFSPHRVEAISGHAMMMEVVVTLRKGE